MPVFCEIAVDSNSQRSSGPAAANKLGQSLAPVPTNWILFLSCMRRRRRQLATTLSIAVSTLYTDMVSAVLLSRATFSRSPLVLTLRATEIEKNSVPGSLKFSKIHGFKIN